VTDQNMQVMTPKNSFTRCHIIGDQLFMSEPVGVMLTHATGQ
jgi:hypothetical protein